MAAKEMASGPASPKGAAACRPGTPDHPGGLVQGVDEALPQLDEELLVGELRRPPTVQPLSGKVKMRSMSEESPARRPQLCPCRG